jgi:signal transduction histidine kinase/DNA-binding response OmpR family regulator
MSLGAFEVALLFLGFGSLAASFAAAIFVFRKRRDAMEAEIEGLRDEIWELRAAAAARDKAEAASQAKSRFLATVSHEIRTPLNGILGLAQLLAMTRLEAEQRSYVEAIGDCSRALARLIDDILDFSKIEAGKTELRIEPFALAPLVESVVELLAPRAHGKNLEISSFISADAPERIVGDPARLRQVLINLAGNAVNFTEKGGVAVRVALQKPDFLRFEVEDTGPGVAPEAREIIFEEFEQGDGSAARRQSGSGLGLAISRRLVAQMGGALEIAATSPRGATFAFALPAHPELKDSAKARPQPLRGRRALIVSKTRFEASFLATYLGEAGASTWIARGEEDGLTRFGATADESFDAVIVDCALGEAATKALATAARAAGAGRIFLLFSPLERRAFGEAALGDFDGWLVKPVRAHSLIERLAEAAAPGAERRAAPPAPCLVGLHVLLAEDNDINALIAVRCLTALGALTTRAENGVRVVELATSAIKGAVAPFGVILMDLFMPELDGLEATKRIRLAEARAGARRTPILALTASAFEEDLRAAKVAGVDAILTKPVEFTKLADTIRTLLETAPMIERRGPKAAAEA